MEIDLPSYMEAMTNFISTFCYLPQLEALKIKVGTCFMFPYGGNNHVRPLWKWFLYDGYHDVTHNRTNLKCSERKGHIFELRSLSMNYLGRKKDI